MIRASHRGALSASWDSCERVPEGAIDNVGKTSKAQDDKKKTFSITVDSLGKIFVGEAPTTLDDLKTSLAKAVEDNPELSVLVRGDVRVGYGDVYEVVKIAKECNVKHLGLVSKET